MDNQQDFKELLALFNVHKVDYLIVGGYGGVPVYYIGKTELISNKRATARKKDLADLEALGEE